MKRRARASRTSRTPRYAPLPAITVSSHLSLAISNLFMTEYLKENPETTTEEFEKVWRALDPESQEVCLFHF